MRLLAAFATLLLTCAHGQEKQLTDIDRELLLEKLADIQTSSNSTVKGRYTVALSAFRAALESDTLTHDLYLDCVEKVRYQDQLKKATEFRDWRKRHKERTDTPAFRLALRHQLRWLVLSLEATRVEEIHTLAPKAISAFEAILRDADKLKGQRSTLNERALGSVFAVAYKVNNANPERWPKSPLALSEIYENLVLPPLRTPKTLTKLRNSWLKRVEHEGLILEAWTNEASGEKDRKPAFEKWLVGGRKQLLWNMEMDLFQNGDEQGAALRMLNHLEANLTHKSAPTWIGQFTNLVEGGASTQPTPDTE